MSTTLIVALVVGGLVIVVGIGFCSQALERVRLERARTLAELQARWNHCHVISNGLPGQYMSQELKSLLLDMEGSLLERLASLDPRNTRHTDQLREVRQQQGKGELQVGNAPLVISDETVAQGVRRQLADLLQLLEQARGDRLLDDQGLLRWSRQIRAYQTEATLNMYRSLADMAIREGKPRVAKLQYERAVAYLTKHADSAHADQMAVFRHLLIQAEQMTVQMEQGAAGTALSEGMQALEEDDQAWRKKALYDD